MSRTPLTETAGGAHVTRRRLLHLALAFGVGAPLLSLEGCGGGKSTFGSPAVSPTPGSGAPLPAGDAAFRAVAIAGLQALAGGRAYPFAALRLVAPSDSALHPARAQKSAPVSGGRTRQVPEDRVFDDVLKLYKRYTPESNTLTVAYSTDAAGSVSAGSARITIDGASAFDTDYTAYPVTIRFQAAVTGGTVPVSGTGTIVFSDRRGGNTLSGSFTLPRNDIRLSGALTLDDSFDVGGTLDIAENGATLHLTQVSGNLDDSLTSPITCEPYGWTGTGTFNLQTGAYSITLDTGNGQGSAAATSDASGNLVIRFADGTTQTIISPLTAFLSGSQTDPAPSPTPTPTPTAPPTSGSSLYAAPVNLAAVSVYAINNAGQILATMPDSANGAFPVFYSRAGATPVVLGGGTNGPSGAGPTVLAMNDKAQILQVSAGGDSLYWSSPTVGPVPFGATGSGKAQPVALNSRAAFVGSIRRNNGNASTAAYWSDPAAPVDLIVPVPPPGSSDTPQYVEASGISPNGQIVGWATSPANPLLYWSSATADPQRLEIPNAYPTGASVASMGINDRGQIYATVKVRDGIGSNSFVYYWPDPTATGQLLPTLGSENEGFAVGINAGGVVVGYSRIGSEVSDRFPTAAVLWKDGQAANLNSLIPAGLDWFLNEATAVNDQGDIVGRGTTRLTGTTPLTQSFLLQPR